jgi:hypothetical protein
MSVLEELVNYNRFFSISLMGETNARNIVKNVLNVLSMNEEEKRLYQLLGDDSFLLQLSEDQLMEELCGIYKQLN